MRIGLNASFWGQESTGSGQYTRQLLRALIQEEGSNEYMLLGPQKPVFSKKTGFCDGRCVPLVLRTPFSGRSENLAKLWFEQLSFPSACRRASVDLAHIPYFASPLRPTVPTVVTVHDLIPLVLPAYRGSVLVRMYTYIVAAAARRADAIVTDSYHSKRDIVNHLHVPADRVEVIYLAADPACHRVTDERRLSEVRQQHNLPDTYVLYLGGFDQRKNLRMLFRAYARAQEAVDGSLPPLVVAGSLPAQDTPLYPDPRRLAAEQGIERSTVFTGWVAEEHKAVLYSGALFFVFLSLYEGFGLMPLEAMACGTPVLASGTSCLPEIVGSGGLLVDPTDEEEIVHGLLELMHNDALRDRLTEEALAQADKFHWRQTAAQTLQVYQRIARASSHC
jgi:glycosyltransferase involved in cell wall biosynthesis